jgi:hypothetical protein
VKIAREWNVSASGAGYVTGFEVLSAFRDTFEVQNAGGIAHQEYWIPAERLPALNAAIVGQIEASAAETPMAKPRFNDPIEPRIRHYGLLASGGPWRGRAR